MALANAEKWLVLVVVLLIIFAGFLLVLMFRTDPGPTKRDKAKVVASVNLSAFTLLTKDNLKLDSGVPSADVSIDTFVGRYLMVGVKNGDEVKPDMVAPEGANKTLNAGAFAVSIPATPSSTLGGQLRVGDLIEVIAVPCKSETPSPAKSETPPPDTSVQKRFEDLLVLNIVAKKDPKPDEKAGDGGAITLAVPRDSRDRFAAAVACANFLVARKIPVKKVEPQSPGN